MPAPAVGTFVSTDAVDPPQTPGRRGVTELVVGFAIALAAMFVFAFIADRVYLQEQFALDTVAWNDELDRPHDVYHGEPIAGLL